jgi:hypothetical protein
MQPFVMLAGGDVGTCFAAGFIALDSIVDWPDIFYNKLMGQNLIPQPLPRIAFRKRAAPNPADRTAPSIPDESAPNSHPDCHRLRHTPAPFSET